MAHDVFVSYSNKDKNVANAIVAELEQEGIRCWIAPRDITPGRSWGEAINEAIEFSKFMVIVLSENSNQSRQVVREVERAVANNVIIIPFRIEDIDPTGAMAYFLSTEHWLDALTPPLEKHIQKLTNTIQVFQGGEERSTTAYLSEELGKPKTHRILQFKYLFFIFIAVLVVASAVFYIPKLIKLNFPGNEDVNPQNIITTEFLSTQTSTPTPMPIPTINLVGSWLTSSEAMNVFVQNDMAYIANGNNGLIILDVSNPSAPAEIGSYPMNNAQYVIVQDQVAFITEQGGIDGTSALGDRLILLDIQTPSIPRFLGEMTFGHRSINYLAVEDQTVYLTRSDSLIAVDVSDPNQMEIAGEFSFYSNVAYPGIAVKDGIVYLIANQLHIVDFRNPADPVEIAVADTGWGSSIALVDQTAFVAGWDDGLTILDVSDPSKPIKLGRFMELVGDYELIPTGAGSRQTFMEVAIKENVAYLSFTFGLDHGTWTQTLESGIVAIDISDPGEPTMITKYRGFEEVSSIFALDDRVYVTDSTRGLFILNKPE